MKYLEYLKIPYKFRGSGVGEGADCYRLVKLFYSKEFGIALPDLDYEEDWYRRENLIVDKYEAEGFIQVDSAKYGDVIVLVEHKVPKHLGIIIDSEYFLHTTKFGTAVHSYVAGTWGTRVYCKLRHRDNHDN